MVHSRCSASFADAIGRVSSLRDTLADRPAVRRVAVARANAVVAKHNSADETIPDDTDLHAAPDRRASRAAEHLRDWVSDQNSRDRTVVAELRLAVHADDVEGAANLDFVGLVAAGGLVPSVFVPSAVAEHAVAPDSVEHAGDSVPVVRVVVPGSAAHAGGFAPNAVAAPADSAARVGGSVASVDFDQLAGLRAGFHAAAVVRHVAVRLAVAQPGVAAVVPAVAARALAVARSGWLPVALFVGPFVPDFPGSVPARGHDAPARLRGWWRRLAARRQASPRLRCPYDLLSLICPSDNYCLGRVVHLQFGKFHSSGGNVCKGVIQREKRNDMIHECTVWDGPKR
jgi:hypothetical protein